MRIMASTAPKFEPILSQEQKTRCDVFAKHLADKIFQKHSDLDGDFKMVQTD